MSEIQEQDQFEDANDTSPRKLATIQTITSVKSIEGADRIVAITFSDNFWTCVAGFGEFKVGDKCVHFEIDAFLPKDERYKVLEGRSNKILKGVDGYRIRTVKFKSQISQGFAIHLAEFPELDQNLENSADVTEDLGIKLYVKPYIGGGRFGFHTGAPKGGFPEHLVKKTDQLRLQSFKHQEILKMFNYDWEVTCKLDGTSCSICVNANRAINYFGEDRGFVNEPGKKYENFEFKVCSRNLEIAEPTDGRSSVYWDVVKKYKIQERLIDYCQKNDRLLAIQGEILAPGVQGNKYYREEPELYVFDIWDITNQCYLNYIDRQTVLKDINNTISDTLNIPHVPVLDIDVNIAPDKQLVLKVVEELTNNGEPIYPVSYWTRFIDLIIEHRVKALIDSADGDSKLHKTPREGLVFKSLQSTKTSFKCISNKFLLKNE